LGLEYISEVVTYKYKEMKTVKNELHNNCIKCPDV